MIRKIVCLLIGLSFFMTSNATNPPEVIGLCIAAPESDRLDQFVSFMENDLAPGGINTLVLRVDYNYKYESYPGIRDEGALSKEQVKRIVDNAHKNGIRLI